MIGQSRVELTTNVHALVGVSTQSWPFFWALARGDSSMFENIMDAVRVRPVRCDKLALTYRSAAVFHAVLTRTTDVWKSQGLRS